MAGSEIAIKGIEITLAILFFVGIIIYVSKFLGLPNLFDPDGFSFNAFKTLGMLYGANWVYKKARARGFKPFAGRKTKAFMEEGKNISKTLKGEQKIKFDAELKSDAKKFAKTTKGKEYFNSAEGKALAEESKSIEQGLVEARATASEVSGARAAVSEARGARTVASELREFANVAREL